MNDILAVIFRKNKHFDRIIISIADELLNLFNLIATDTGLCLLRELFTSEDSGMGMTGVLFFENRTFG